MLATVLSESWRAMEMPRRSLRTSVTWALFMATSVLESAPRVRCALTDAYRHQRDGQGGDVGEHVRRVRDERQALRDDAADELHKEEGGGQPEGDLQRLLVRAGSVIVTGVTAAGRRVRLFLSLRHSYSPLSVDSPGRWLGYGLVFIAPVGPAV